MALIEIVRFWLHFCGPGGYAGTQDTYTCFEQTAYPFHLIPTRGCLNGPMVRDEAALARVALRLIEACLKLGLELGPSRMVPQFQQDRQLRAQGFRWHLLLLWPRGL